MCLPSYNTALYKVWQEEAQDITTATMVINASMRECNWVNKITKLIF